MGVNVLQELSAEQAKFKAEITEDRFKYKSPGLIATNQ